jgi:hypothetical protein
MSRRILITAPGSLLGQALARALAPEHSVITIPDEILGDRDRLTTSAGQVDTIIHLVDEIRGDPDGALDRATRGTYDLLTVTTPDRFILVSSLRPLLGYSPDLAVSELFAPRPTTNYDDLIPYLAEITLREVSRALPVNAIVLRVGQIVQSAQGATPLDLHLDDAVQAVQRALDYSGLDQERPSRFNVFHIVDGGSGSQFLLGAAAVPSFGYVPVHSLTEGMTPQEPVSRPRRTFADPTSPVERITIYGAGGPIPAETAEVLAPGSILRLTDILSIDELQNRPPQSEGAPQLARYDAPHEHRVVDVTREAEVVSAAEGADALIVCTVIRPHPVDAFRVNMLGARNIMRAAVTHGIRRVVHTGPVLNLSRHPYGFDDEFGLLDDLNPRPGDNLYFISKFLGQEIVRIYAEEHELIVPNLLFGGFYNPELPTTNRKQFSPFSISWRDCANAIALAARVPSLPRPFETMHVLADLPHGKFRNEKAKRLLGWQPHDDLSAYWLRNRSQ